MRCEVCRVRCELKLGCTICILFFSSFSTEIGELKDEEAKMHNVSHPLSFSRLAGNSSWLAGVSSWLAGVSSWLAGVSSWLAGVVRCEAGGVRCEVCGVRCDV